MAKPKLALIPCTQGYFYSSVLPSDGSGDFRGGRSGKATRINSQGLIEEVDDGVSRLNYPMIDGKVVGCPHHILEPQRTNIATYSEDYGNSSWIKLNGTVSTNVTTSVDGSVNADLFLPNTTSGVHALRSNIFNQSSTASHSWFVKANGYNKVAVRESELVGNYASFDLSIGSVISTNQNASIVNFGNGWYRLTLVDTTTGANAQTSIVVLPESYTSGNPLVNWSGDGIKGIYVFGTQVEIGSYPTSYLKTSSSSYTTRSAETANGSGDAATFNDSEGVLMAEISKIDISQSLGSLFLMKDLDNSIRLNFSTSNRFNFFVKVGGVNQVDFDTYNYELEDYNKILVSYKLNEYSLWFNGYKIFTDTNATVSSGLNELKYNDFYGNTKQVQYYNSALTDSELEKISSWTSFSDMAQAQQYSIK